MEVFTEARKSICKTFSKISRVILFHFVLFLISHYVSTEGSILSGVLTDDILHFASKVLQDVQQTNELLQQSNKWGPEKVNAFL